MTARTLRTKRAWATASGERAAQSRRAAFLATERARADRAAGDRGLPGADARRSRHGRARTPSSSRRRRPPSARRSGRARSSSLTPCGWCSASPAPTASISAAPHRRGPGRALRRLLSRRPGCNITRPLPASLCAGSGCSSTASSSSRCTPRRPRSAGAASPSWSPPGRSAGSGGCRPGSWRRPRRS